MKAFGTYTRIGVCLLCLAGAGVCAADSPLSHDEAVRALTHSEAATRRDAIIWLGNQGSMDDLPGLAASLRDEDTGVRELAQDALIQLWTRSGDSHIDDLMKAGIRQMSDGHLGHAVDTFSRIVELMPEFAEGWNKRATVYYMIGNYESSLKDCDEVMRRNPLHFGALAGYGLIYSRLGKWEQALDYFERALDVNPNMTNIAESVVAIRHRLGKQGRQSI